MTDAQLRELQDQAELATSASTEAARRRRVGFTEAHEDGRTYDQIGAAVGLSKQRVGQIITGEK